MGETTKIGWTNSSVNFWRGCDMVSAGCQNCYITRATPLRVAGQKHGDPRVWQESAVALALKLNRKPWVCKQCGAATQYPPGRGELHPCHCGVDFERRRVFSLSLGDWLDPKVPVEWLARMLATIRECNQVTWILCTKRPELWEERLRAVCVLLQSSGDGSHLDNPLWHWLNQWIGEMREADSRGNLKKTMCTKRGLAGCRRAERC